MGKARGHVGETVANGLGTISDGVVCLGCGIVNPGNGLAGKRGPASAFEKGAGLNVTC